MTQSTDEKVDPIVQEVFLAESALPSPRADQHGMITPIFAMKPGNNKTVEYTNSKGGMIKVTPAQGIGRATVEDRDLLLFVLSIMNQACEKDAEKWSTPRTIRFKLIDFFRFCGQKKSISSQQITRVEYALRRLRGTTIETNLKTGDTEITTEFSLISSWSLTKKEHRQRGRGHAVMVEIELCRWLHNAVLSKKEILKINPLYFRLPALQRRLYEIARKCVGYQLSSCFPITFKHENLLAMLGTDREKKKVMADLRAIQKTQPVPDYLFEVTSKYVRIIKKTTPKAASGDDLNQHDYSSNVNDYEPADEPSNGIADSVVYEYPDDISEVREDDIALDHNPFDLSYSNDIFYSGSDGLDIDPDYDYELPDPSD